MVTPSRSSARRQAKTGLDDAQLELVRRDRAARLLYVTSQIAVGEFHCPPDDPRWAEENCADEGYFVAFPGTSVVIELMGREATVMTRNEVVLYNQGQSYRRGLLDRSGDHCVFLLVAPGLLAEIAAAAGCTQQRERVAFCSNVGALPASMFLLQRLIVRTLHGEPARLDRLQLEDALYRLAVDAARIGFKANDRQPHARRGHTIRAHALVVERTKALLSRRLKEQLSLAQIAREMLVSPFHLSRIFRAHTGFGIHEYRDHLRLRLALDLVLERDVTLSALARELGYASHSHFTDSFRRVFGLPPSALRPTVRALGEGSELLTDGL
jgi:AraC-like DNA-binding protein